MQINFEPKAHIYAVDGEIATISVTELLAKHKLAPDYSSVNKAKLEDSAQIGKEVHQDLENILREIDYEPKTPQGENFKKWAEENLDCGAPEFMLGLNYNGMIIAGTADVMGWLKDGTPFIADHKNTSKFHKEYVSWQVSILDYMARKLKGERINEIKVFHWEGAQKFYCFHYDPKSGEMKVIELEKVSDEEIEKLILAEYNNEIYQRPILYVESELVAKMEKAEKLLARIENRKKAIEKEEKEMKEKLCELMESQGIYKWESPNGTIKATYVAPIERQVVDSTTLKRELPQVYEKYLKITKQKAYVKLTVKGEEE